jgi:histidine triad (HIT) family protein
VTYVDPTHSLQAGCVFCQIIRHEVGAEFVDEWGDAIAIVPLNPVTPGHVLVIPKRHVADALEETSMTAVSFMRAAQIAKGPCNLITSCGREATQTIGHLHVHIVPRRDGDGLHLPWTPHGMG